MKRHIALLVSIVILLINTTSVFATDVILPPKVDAQGAVLMDFETGRVLWGKNEDVPMAMASTTKIMTAIIALEESNLDDIVVASERAAAAPRTKMDLTAGEEMPMEDLLYALMIQSSNDAAIAIAEHISGSVESFCDYMNEKAKELGAQNTLFATPNGLDDDIEHHSTAYDMALITRYALNNEKFVEIINADSITLPINGGNYRNYPLQNTNRMLTSYEGAFGVKTGYTSKAGQCFAGAAKRDDITLVSIVLASGWGSKGKEQKWVDTKTLLDYGFENYSNFQIISKDDYVQDIAVELSKEKTVGLVYGSDLTILIAEEEKNDIETEIFIPEYITAPVSKGDIVGEAEVYIKDQLVGTVDIVANEDILRHDFETSFRKIINNWLNMDFKGIL